MAPSRKERVLGGETRVLFVDDEPRLRAAWERLIAMQPDMTCVGVLPDADQLVEQVGRTRAQVVLLDASMPGRDPIAVAAELSEGNPECRVVIYSGHNDPDLMRQAHAAGVWGFVDKLDEPRIILETVRRVAAGEPVFPAGFDR